MKFLIDECLRRQLAVRLNDLGHDAIHVVDAGLAGCPDDEIMQFARKDGHVVVSADTDFGEILARSQATSPSILLFRGQSHDIDNLLRLITGLLQEVEADLGNGAIVVIGRNRARVRQLPIGG